MRRVLHTFGSYQRAREALQEFLNEHKGAGVRFPEMTVTTDTERHVFLPVADDHGMSRLLGSEWHAIHFHTGIKPEYRARLACRVRLGTPGSITSPEEV